MNELFKSPISIDAHMAILCISLVFTIPITFIFKNYYAYVLAIIVCYCLLYYIIPRYSFYNDFVTRFNMFGIKHIRIDEILYICFIRGGKGGDSFRIHLKVGKTYHNIILRDSDYNNFFKYLESHDIKYILINNPTMLHYAEDKDHVLSVSKQNEKIVKQILGKKKIYR